jgi:hypothetical protein
MTTMMLMIQMMMRVNRFLERRIVSPAVLLSDIQL